MAPGIRSICSGSSGGEGYEYNAVGNITALHNVVAVPTGAGAIGGPVDQTFTYDGLDQLTGATGIFTTSTGERRYTQDLKYDAIGNIAHNEQAAVRIDLAGHSTSEADLSHVWGYDYGGPRPHAATQIGNRAVEYDADGNQASWVDGSASRNFVWDEEDRLLEVNDGSGSSITSFLYNGDGTRTHRIHEKDVTVYPNQFYTVRNGEVTSRHVFVGETRVASNVTAPSAGTLTFYYHSDHLQSTEFVTNAAGNVVEHEESFPFGESWVTELSASDRVPYLFTGKELDQETGLYYFGARYYDPRVAQWASGDPALPDFLGDGRIYLPARLGVYTYSWNTPLKVRDFDGRDGIDINTAWYYTRGPGRLTTLGREHGASDVMAEASVPYNFAAGVAAAYMPGAGPPDVGTPGEIFAGEVGYYAASGVGVIFAAMSAASNEARAASGGSHGGGGGRGGGGTGGSGTGGSGTGGSGTGGSGTGGGGAGAPSQAGVPFDPATATPGAIIENVNPQTLNAGTPVLHEGPLNTHRQNVGTNRVQPIEVTRDGTIYNGNHRARAAADHGAPVVVRVRASDPGPATSYGPVTSLPVIPSPRSGGCAPDRQ